MSPSKNQRVYDRPLGGVIGYRAVQELLWNFISKKVRSKEFISRDLASAVEVDEKTVRKHLWDLVREGKLTATGQAGRFVVFRMIESD